MQIPLDPNEQGILDSLLSIRDELSFLKQDKSTYIKTHDVLMLYQAVMDNVVALNQIRADAGKPREQNRGKDLVVYLSNRSES